MPLMRVLAFVVLLVAQPVMEVLAQSADGYWSFVKMEVRNDRQESATFEGEAGNLKMSQTIVLNLDTGAKQSLSAVFNWDAPPRVLIPGKKLKVPLKTTVLVNTHPNGTARGMDGGGTVYFGWVLGPGGSFKDKDGNHMVGFASYGDKIGDMIRIQTGEKKLEGEREIPVGNSLDKDDPQNSVPIVVSLNYGNDVREFAYVYRWNAGPPPKVQDIAGAWKHGANGETWTFTPKGDGTYTATEKGFDNATGTATFKDNKIHIDYKNTKGVSGVYDIAISDDGQTGKGTWNDDSPDSGTREFVKIDKPINGPEDQSVTQFTVRAGSRRVNAGDTVLLPIDLIKSHGLGNINVTVEYVANVVQVTAKPTAGSVKGSRSFEANHAQSGIVYLGLAGSAGIESDGQLALIPFKAVGQPGDRTDVNVTVTTANNADGQTMKALTITGAIEIVKTGGDGSGDTDNDNKITGKDALDALKMSVKLLPENLAADMDSDSRVTSNDARLILLKVVGK